MRNSHEKKIKSPSDRFPRSASRYPEPLQTSKKKSVKKKESSKAIEVEQEFLEIKEKEGLNDPADATEIHSAEIENRHLAEVAGLDEPGALSEPQPPKDVAAVVEEAERIDPLIVKDVEIPSNTEELAEGDRKEDTDHPLNFQDTSDRIAP